MAATSEEINLEVSTYQHGDDIFTSSSFFDSKEERPNYLSLGIADFLKNEGYLPKGSEIFVPTQAAITPSWESLGWFCIYEIAFRVGFRIPCPPIFRETIEALGLSPCQLMPSCWKLLYGVSFICQKYDLPLSAQDIINNYYARGYGRGKVIFRIRPNCPHLITNLDSGDDKMWCEKFMFIKKSSLGEDGAFIPESLSNKVSEEWKVASSPESTARVDAFLACPEVERSWSELSKIMFSSHTRVDPKPLKIEGPPDAVTKGTTPGPRTRGRLNVVNVKERVETLKKTGVTTAALPKFRPLKITSGTRVAPEVSEVSKEKVTSAPKGKSVQFNEPVSNTTETKKRKIAEVFGVDFSEEEVPNLPLNKGQRYIDLHKEVATARVFEIGSEGLAQRSAHAAFQTLESIAALGCVIQQERANSSGLQDKVVGLEATCASLRKELSQEMKAVLSAQSKVKELEALVEKSGTEVSELQLKVAELESAQDSREHDLVLYYSLCTKIHMMRATDEERKDWDLNAEEELYKQLFLGEEVLESLDVTPSREAGGDAEEGPHASSSGLADKEEDDDES
ncbi:hypothetical protein RND81_02G179100 [Saponaria officinalis]|uniref:Uncharacterized protein n=1 Tax=Saponaria officinalis TaxID=3572 RepID=A0AAW1MYT9_SAPOF